MTPEQIKEINDKLAEYPDGMFCDVPPEHYHGLLQPEDGVPREEPATGGTRERQRVGGVSPISHQNCDCGSPRCGFERMKRVNRGRI